MNSEKRQKPQYAAEYNVYETEFNQKKSESKLSTNLELNVETQTKKILCHFQTERIHSNPKNHAQTSANAIQE